MARSHVARQLVKLGGAPVWREGFVTDNGNLISRWPLTTGCCLDRMWGIESVKVHTDLIFIILLRGCICRHPGYALRHPPE